MKFLIFLFTIMFSSSIFAAEEKLDLYCSSPDTSSSVYIKMTLNIDDGVALGQYVFQATSDGPDTPSTFEPIKNKKGIYVVANNVHFSILVKKFSRSEWIALVTVFPSGVQITLPCMN